MEFDRQFELLAHPELVRLARHCESLAAPSQLPRREDFDPAPLLRYLFGRLYIVDVLDGGTDYRFRLFGMYWQTIYGSNLAGKRLSDIEATGNLLNLRAHYDACVAKRAPIFRPGKLVWPDRRAIAYQRLLIPFSDGDSRVSMLLCAAYCDISREDLCLFQGAGLPQLVLDEPAKPDSPHDQSPQRPDTLSN